MTVPRFIIVEGVIAAGKSALVEAVAQRLTQRGIQAYAVGEPVTEWEAGGLLAEFYRDPAGAGLAFQLFAAATRARAVAAAAAAHPGAVLVLERSAASDRLFFNLLRRDLPPHAGAAYDAAAPLLTAGAFAAAGLPPADLAAWRAAPVAYLRVAPAVAAARGAARGRPAERMKRVSPTSDSAAGGVSPAYLERLARAHDALLLGDDVRGEFPAEVAAWAVAQSVGAPPAAVVPEWLALDDFRAGAARTAVADWVIGALAII